MDCKYLNSSMKFCLRLATQGPYTPISHHSKLSKLFLSLIDREKVPLKESILLQMEGYQPIKMPPETPWEGKYSYYDRRPPPMDRRRLAEKKSSLVSHNIKKSYLY